MTAGYCPVTGVFGNKGSTWAADRCTSSGALSGGVVGLAMSNDAPY
jgi:hypothetical protein